MDRPSRDAGLSTGYPPSRCILAAVGIPQEDRAVRAVRPARGADGTGTAQAGERLVYPSRRAPLPGEAVIATGDELHRYCRQKGILFLFYVGFNTNACILLRDYGTIEMSNRGYEIILVRDCTTGMESFETADQLWQTRCAIQFLEMFGKYSITSDELIHALDDRVAR